MCSKKILKKACFHCALPLLIGFTTYLFLNKPDLLLHKWMYNFLSLPNYYGIIKNSTIGIFFINHFADCLWAYSLSWFLILFISDSLSFNTKAALIVLIVSCTEVVQLLFNKQFTFDWIDLFLTTAISFITLITCSHEKENTF